MNGVDPELLRVRRESRNCQTCGGDGLVIVFHPRWTGSRVASIFAGEIEQTETAGGTVEYRHVHEATAMEVAAHCVCALGRWMRQRVEPDLQGRIPDVEAIVDGRSKWLLEPPEHHVATRKPHRIAQDAPREAVAAMVDRFCVNADSSRHAAF